MVSLYVRRPNRRPTFNLRTTLHSFVFRTMPKTADFLRRKRPGDPQTTPRLSDTPSAAWPLGKSLKTGLLDRLAAARRAPLASAAACWAYVRSILRSRLAQQAAVFGLGWLNAMRC